MCGLKRSVIASSNLTPTLMATIIEQSDGDAGKMIRCRDDDAKRLIINIVLPFGDFEIRIAFKERANNHLRTLIFMVGMSRIAENVPLH